METMTESTTDKRVDDLRGEMRRGFDQVDGRLDRVDSDIRELRAEVKSGNAMLRAEIKAGDDSAKEGFAAINVRFDSLQSMMISLQRMMIWFFATTLAGIIGAVIAGVMLHF
jgi:hypothetical protein